MKKTRNSKSTKRIILCSALLAGLSLTASAQVKIGDNPNQIVPGARLQVDGNNSTTGAAKLLIDNSGNTGIGTAAPTNRLHVTATGTNDPVRIENLQTGALQGKELVVDNTGVVKQLPGKLIASGDVNTYTALGASNVEVVLPFSNVVQNTTGGTLTASSFTVPATGVYEVDFAADFRFTAVMPAGSLVRNSTDDGTVNVNDAAGDVVYYMYDVDANTRIGDKGNGAICATQITGNPTGATPTGSPRFSSGTKFFVTLTAGQRVEFRVKPYIATANIISARICYVSIQQIN